MPEEHSPLMSRTDIVVNIHDIYYLANKIKILTSCCGSKTKVEMARISLFNLLFTYSTSDMVQIKPYLADPDSCQTLNQQYTDFINKLLLVAQNAFFYRGNNKDLIISANRCSAAVLQQLHRLTTQVFNNAESDLSELSKICYWKDYLKF